MQMMGIVNQQGGALLSLVTGKAKGVDIDVVVATFKGRDSQAFVGIHASLLEIGWQAINTSKSTTLCVSRK
jgi:hypothetical protein